MIYLCSFTKPGSYSFISRIIPHYRTSRWRRVDLISESCTWLWNALNHWPTSHSIKNKQFENLKFRSKGMLQQMFTTINKWLRRQIKSDQNTLKALPEHTVIHCPQKEITLFLVQSNSCNSSWQIFTKFNSTTESTRISSSSAKHLNLNNVSTPVPIQFLARIGLKSFRNQEVLHAVERNVEVHVIALVILHDRFGIQPVFLQPVTEARRTFFSRTKIVSIV